MLNRGAAIYVPPKLALKFYMSYIA